MYGRVRGKSGKGQGFGSLGGSHVFGASRKDLYSQVTLYPFIPMDSVSLQAFQPYKRSIPMDPLSLWTLSLCRPPILMDPLAVWTSRPSIPWTLYSSRLSIPMHLLSFQIFYPLDSLSLQTLYPSLQILYLYGSSIPMDPLSLQTLYPHMLQRFRLIQLRVEND